MSVIDFGAHWARAIVFALVLRGRGTGVERVACKRPDGAGQVGRVVFVMKRGEAVVVEMVGDRVHHHWRKRES